MKILVTGATGFVGRHLIRNLAVEDKYKVVIDSLSSILNKKILLLKKKV